MPKLYPKEFRDDVVAVARKGEAPLNQIAKDFGIFEGCLHGWMRMANIEDGARPGPTAAESAQLRESRKRIRLLEQEAEVMRRAVAYLARDVKPKMMYLQVLEIAAADAPIRVPITVTCGVLGLSTNAFYKWRANPVCARDLDDAYLTNAAYDLHPDDPEFGYRLIADDLRDAGHKFCDNRVWRLRSHQRLWSVHSKKRGLNRKAGPPHHDDLLAVTDKHSRTTHRFTATRPTGSG